MASQWPLSPWTAANWTSPASGNNWVNVTNMQVEDGIFSTSTWWLYTFYGLCTTYGFTVPSWATIDGIVVSVKKKWTNNPGNSDYVYDKSVKMIKWGSIVGSEKADTITKWSSTLWFVNYGWVSDLWGTTWTADDINASNFWIWFSADPSPWDGVATASIDVVQITVYYTTSGWARKTLWLLGVG